MSVFSIGKFKFFGTSKTVKTQQSASTSKTSWNPLKRKSGSSKQTATPPADQFTRMERQVQQLETAANKAHSKAQAKLDKQLGKFDKQSQKLAQSEAALNRGLERASGMNKIDDAEVNALIQQIQRQVAKEQMKKLPQAPKNASTSNSPKKPAMDEKTLQARLDALKGTPKRTPTVLELEARLKQLKGEKLTSKDLDLLLPEAPKGKINQ